MTRYLVQPRDQLYNQLHMHLKLSQEKQSIGQHKQLVIWLLIKLIKQQKNYHKILQRQLKVKQKYQKKDIYLQKKRQQIIDDLRLT